MPIRNPFARRPGPAANQDENENERPGSALVTETTTDAAHPGFERVDTVGSKASSSAFSIRSSRKSQDTGEYKMSVVNDSGVYLPPSPVEREAAWPRRYLARTSSDNNKSGSELEHFSISRESFDSYRRSFDICAKSPVVTPPLTRQSLDSMRMNGGGSSRRSPFFLSSPSSPKRFFPRSPGLGGGSGGSGGRFEDVGLGDDGLSRTKQQQQPPQQPQKKRGFFAKFGSDSPAPAAAGHAAEETTGGGAGGTVMSRFLPLGGGGGGGGRKRAQSGGQGAELGVMPVVGQAQEVGV
ncbi:hypothetical protein C8A00DRAFT_18599 [Chaetomidium leptoderma]|uniref:Uncharacterized protein n=1 Tax=Chaetomidium leptoderma TaxID=669021 RepID=A0AAN6VE21_9PEZI|nr:hypothetical protein C8A00DRAFT_18599 [Chaetomidium leptoderma]